MEIQLKEDLSNYKFVDQSNLLLAVYWWWYKLTGMSDIVIPVIRNKSSTRDIMGWGRFREYFLFKAAKLLGINTETNNPMLKWHDKRLRNLELGLTFLGIVISYGFVLLSESFSSQLLFLFIGGFVLYIPIILVYRLSILMLRKNYSDSLSAMNGVYLVLELFHPEGISTPTHRKRIQTRLNSLSKSILLLAQRYRSSSAENEQLIYRHFHAMESYIRERERWVVLPKENTLVDLRKDFAALLPILINGNYGDFAAPVTELQERPQEVPYWRKIAGGILALIGLVIPIISLVNLYILKSKDFLPADTDPTTFTAIMAAWLLLTLDSILKLGLIETFTNLVKSVRELR